MADASGAHPRRSRLRRALMFPLAFVLVASLWEFYKAIGPAKGGSILGIRVLPRTDDQSMSHVWDMWSRLWQPEVRGNSTRIISVVAQATFYSLRVSLLAFVLGSALGIGLAVLMARFRIAERALMPYLVISQTVPIIVLAPLIAALMAFASRDLASKTWIAAVILGVFLSLIHI